MSSKLLIFTAALAPLFGGGSALRKVLPEHCPPPQKPRQHQRPRRADRLPGTRRRRHQKTLPAPTAAPPCACWLRLRLSSDADVQVALKGRQQMRGSVQPPHRQALALPRLSRGAGHVAARATARCSGHDVSIARRDLSGGSCRAHGAGGAPALKPVAFGALTLTSAQMLVETRHDLDEVARHER